MNLNEWSEKIHALAVEKGWWDDARPLGETFALIHAELSEALEAARNGEPPVWHLCHFDGKGCEKEACSHWDGYCVERADKPEGVATEIIDAVIRLLDWCGKEGITLRHPHASIDLLTGGDLEANGFGEITNVGEAVNDLHIMLNDVFLEAPPIVSPDALETAIASFIAHCFGICYRLGVTNIEALMADKHAFNRTRERKHGKLF